VPVSHVCARCVRPVEARQLRLWQSIARSGALQSMHCREGPEDRGHSLTLRPLVLMITLVRSLSLLQEVEEHRSARRAERPALIDCFAINCRAVGKYPSSSTMRQSPVAADERKGSRDQALVRLSARCPALPFAFSTSSALTNSMVEKKAHPFRRLTVPNQP